MKAGGRGPDARRLDVQTDNAPYRKTRSDGLTGGFGKVPIQILQDTALSVFERFLIAYLSVHRDGFGINHRRVHKLIRQLGGRKMVQRAIRNLRKRRLMERRRTPRGYAVDSLTFKSPTEDFVLVECQLFDGTLTAREIVAVLYIRSCHGHVQPWQLRKVLGDGVKKCGRSTLNGCLRTLEDASLARNVGTAAQPLWRAPQPKKSTLPKGAHLPKRTLPKRTPTRKIIPPRIEATGEKGWDRGPLNLRADTGVDCGTVSVANSASVSSRSSLPDAIPLANHSSEFGDRIPVLGSDEGANLSKLSERLMAKMTFEDEVEQIYAQRDLFMARAHDEFERGKRFFATADALTRRAERLVDDHFSVNVSPEDNRPRPLLVRYGSGRPGTRR